MPNKNGQNISIKKNYLLNTSYQVLTLIVPLITAPYLSRTLGADGIGIYSYCFSIVSYFILFAVLGSSTYGQKRIAADRDDEERLSRSFWEIFFLRTITVCITSVVYIFFLSSVKQYKTLYIILGLNIFNVLTDITWFYQGIEDFSKVVLRNIAARIAQVICIFVFIKSADDLGVYIFITVIFVLVANFWTWVSVPQYIKRVEKINPFSNIKEIITLFIPTIAIQVYLVLDKTMIGVITNSAYQNGCYEQAEKIVRMALTVVTSIAAVILPRVANLYNNGKEQEAKEYIYKGFKVVFLLSLPMMLGLAAISDVFVPVFFGPGFDLAEILMPIFSVLILAVSISYVVGFAFLIPIGKQHVYTIIVCCGAVANFSLNFILIPRIGAVGAAIASIIAECLVAVAQIAFCCHRGLLSGKRILEGSLRYAITSGIMCSAIMLCKSFVPLNLMGLSILIFFGIAIYFLVLTIIRDTFFTSNLRMILRSIKRT